MIRATICGILLASFTAGFAADTNSNLLRNGGFEMPTGPDGVPRGWRSYVPRRTAEISTTATLPVEGTQCAAIETTSDLVAIIVTDPPSEVAPGEELTMKVDFRAEDLLSDSGGSATFNACFLNAEHRIIRWDRTLPTPAPDGSWKEFSHSVRVPESAAYMMFQVGMRSARGRTWWDNGRLSSSSTVALRIDLPKSGPAFGETTLSAVLMNRSAKLSRDIAVVTNPGNHTTRTKLDIGTTGAISLPFTFDKRGEVILSAEVLSERDNRRLFTTTHTVTVPDALVVEPLSPTHYVVEDGAPARFHAEVSANVEPAMREGLTVECTVRDSSGKIVMGAPAAPIVSNRAAFDVAAGKKDAPVPGDYRATFDLHHKGTRIASAEEDWHIIRRAQSHVTVSPDGFPVVDGKKFFPIALYMTPPRRYPEVREAGFNLMQSYPAFAGPQSSNRTAKKFLDQVHAAGLKALTFVSHGQDRLSEEDAVRRVRILKNHPAILAWYQEEVLARGYKPFSYLQNHVEMLRREAPEHPILIGDQRGESGAMVGNPRFFPDELMDFGTWWWYPTPLRAQPSVENYEGEPSGPEKEYKPPKFLVESGTSKPIWPAMQCYRKQNQTDARFPTPAEYRAQAYIVICHGAKGLLYYTGEGEFGNGILSSPEAGNWEYLKELVGELRDMSPVFMSPDADAQPELITSGALVSARIKQTDKGRVMLAVNRGIAPVKAGFRVKDISAPIPVRGESRNVEPLNGVLADNFDSYAVHIYELP